LFFEVFTFNIYLTASSNPVQKNLNKPQNPAGFGFFKPFFLNPVALRLTVWFLCLSAGVLVVP